MVQGQSDPQLIRRSRGDWLALSCRGDSLRIGVIGDTAEAARDAFYASLEAWNRNLASAGSCPALPPVDAA